MIIDRKTFYLEEIDTDIPELQAAKELYMSGDDEGADRAFATYFKSYLKPEVYFGEDYSEKSKKKSTVIDPNGSLIENADGIVKGRVRSCSYTYDYNGEIDWNFNGAPDGYKEWLWQLNRHHVFKVLGLAYALTGDEKYADAFQRHMCGWLRQAECPMWPVPNRSSKVPTWRTISAGIRAGNWSSAIHHFLYSPTIKDETWVKIAMSIWEHCQLLKHSPSSLNWLDIELNGLHTFSTIYRFFKKNDEWRNHAVALMIHELETQVYKDGFQCELTTGYQSVVISTNLSVWNIAKKYGMPMPDEYKQGIRLLYTMYPKLMRPDGKTPCTNDGSNAEVMQRMTEALRYFEGDEEFTAVLEGRVSEIYPRDVVMEYAGMITTRTGWGENDVWLFFESAPFGAGHQHNDKLNIDLYAYGKNMLDVIGNFAYDKSDMRSLCVRTRGHNTGLVDNMGQHARPTHTPWAAEKVNIKSDLEVNIKEDTVVAYGKYNRGYGEELTPVTHERRVVFFRHGIEGSLPFFVLLDTFTAHDEAEHKCEISFPMLDRPLTLKGRHATLHAGDGVTLEIVTHAALATVTGAYYPEYMGFRPTPGERLVEEHIPAPVLSIYGYGKEVRFATVLFPTPDGAAPEIGVKCDEESFTVTLDGVEHRFSRDEEFLKTYPV